MKKVMIGILILIPVVILLIVLAVGAIVSIDAYFAVEDITIEDVDGNPVREIVIDNAEFASGSIDFDIHDHVIVTVYPEKATDKTVTWTLEELQCLDDDYEQSYYYYLDHMGEVSRVNPVAMLVDEDDQEVESNTTGKVRISSYCSFKLRAQAGLHAVDIQVEIVGYDVKKVTISTVDEEDSTLVVGEAVRLSANYVPIDSIVNSVIWSSDNESVATVDQNGIVKAVGVGTAHITHRASVYSTERGEVAFVSSAPFEIKVEAGASTIYGNSVTTSKSLLTLSELGLDDGYTVVSGGVQDGNQITVVDNVVVLRNGTKEFTINACESGDIVIDNAKLFDNREDLNEFVLEVQGSTLTLKVRYADDMATGTLGAVVWTSSNVSVATVENGVVKGLAEGVVTITATVGDKSADIELNVRSKVKTMRLLRTNLFYAVGIARETVFASHRYVDVKVDNTKEANSVLVLIQGEPEEESKLAEFYSAYNFEVVEGTEFAHFDNETRNKLVFDGDELEGEGRQMVVIRVSAKYPKYEALTQYTTAEVAYNVVYGVEVHDAFELKQASFDQEAYACDNKVLSKDYHGKDCYISSSRTLAITLGDDIPLDQEYANAYYDQDYFNQKGDKKLNDISRFDLYGSVYGNNHIVYSWKEFIADKYFEIFHVAWSDVTFSNVRVRVNTLGDDESSFSNDDTKGLWGDCIDVETISTEWNPNTWGRAHLQNIRIEFCLLENGIKVSSLYNADVTYDGCVLRNVAQCGMYVRTAFDEVVMDGEPLIYPHYTHLSMHNVVASNMLGTLASISYDRYSIIDANTPRFKADPAENDEYIIKEFVEKGYNTEFNQTGFLDLYNWQPASATNMLNTGNEKVNALIQQAIGALVDTHPQMDQFKYKWTRKEGMPAEIWFHMGFVSVGVSNFPESEKCYLKTSFEDKNFRHFDAHDLEVIEDDDYAFLHAIFQSLDFHMYLYDNTSPITPESKVPDGIDLINHLHE